MLFLPHRANEGARWAGMYGGRSGHRAKESGDQERPVLPAVARPEVHGPRVLTALGETAAP